MSSAKCDVDSVEDRDVEMNLHCEVSAFSGVVAVVMKQVGHGLCDDYVMTLPAGHLYSFQTLTSVMQKIGSSESHVAV